MVDIFARLEKNAGGPIGQYMSYAHGYYAFPKLEGEIGPHMTFRGKKVLNWSLNNYLGLANLPEVRQADAEGAAKFGMAAPMGARMMSGQTVYHEQLERELAEFVGKEDAFLLNFGYQGMISIIDCLLTPRDVVVYDAEAHACIIDGLRMHKGKRFVFGHNDMESLRLQLQHATDLAEEQNGGVLVITEGVFGMKGDLGKLDEIVALFPSPFIHIGGDEVHYGNQSWFTDPEIQQFIKDKNLGNETGLEQYFIRRAADIVASKGKTMIGWDEMIDAGVSPEKAVVMWWRHDRKHQLVKALENGYRVIMTPRRPLYADFIQYGGHKVGRVWGGYNAIEDIYRFPEPIIHLTRGYEDLVMGLQFSLWTERVADAKRLDYMTFPRLVAVAESAWTPVESKECSLFMQKLPYFLQFLGEKGIYYFNPFNPESTPEPGAPDKDDVLKNG